MASAYLKAELECSICLNIFTDPVMLKCGHNFCRLCIDCVLNTQNGCGRGYSCPECRETFQERPALNRNIKLRNIVENFLSIQPDQEESDILCCIHRKTLEYYCTEDDTCVCVSCCLVGDHTGHKMESLEEASGKKKNQMRDVLQKLLKKRGKTEERIQRLQKHKRVTEEKSANGKEKVTAVFRDLRRELKVLEERILSHISGEASHDSLSTLNLIQELEIKKEELSKRMHHIEELCSRTEPLTVLQKSHPANWSITEDGDDEDGHGNLFCNEEYLDMAAISEILQTGLCDIMSRVNVLKYSGTYLYPHFSTEDDSSNFAEPFQGAPQPASTIPDAHHQPERQSTYSSLRMSGLSNNTDILLDINTAGNDLCISDNRKTVSYSVFTQKYPETQERFQCAQVISIESFSSGQHYWDVDVERSQVWSVGMCYPSITRKGCHSEIGWNKKSWGLHKSWLNNQYSVLYDRNWIRLPGMVSSKGVRIYVNYEAGQISFYDMCTPIRHLYTFNATFTEPLHAVLWVGGGCLKISRGNQYP